MSDENTPKNSTTGDRYYGRFDGSVDTDSVTDESMTPEIEALIDELADLCAQSMKGEGDLAGEPLTRLVKSLSANGWKRHTNDSAPLSTIVEKRVRQRHPEPAIHRGGAIENLTARIQEEFNDVTRYQTSDPASVKENRQQPGQPRTNLS